MEAWVLWHRYLDGSSAHVERVYLDEVRAQADFVLIDKASHGAEWKLDKVEVFGDQ